MIVSSRILLLSLSLTVAISGCSRSRVRQLFAPEREFLSLSELRDSHNSEQQPESQLASNSTDDGTTDKGGPFESLARAMPWRRHPDKIPADPFLNTDNQKRIRETESLPVITAASSGPADDRESSVDFPGTADNRPVPQLNPLIPEFGGESRTAAVAQDASFDTFIRDLGTAEDSDHLDSEQSMRKRIAADSESHSDPDAFDSLVSSSPRLPEPGVPSGVAADTDGDVILSFDMLDESTRPDRYGPDDGSDLVLKFEKEPAQALVPDVEPEHDVARGLFGSEPPVAEEKSSGSDEILQDIAADSGHLWEAADKPFDWQESGQEMVPHPSAASPWSAGVGPRGSGGTAFEGAPADGRTARQGTHNPSDPAAGNDLVLPTPLASVSVDRRPPQSATFPPLNLDDDLFFEDFTEQADAAVAPEPAPVAPSRSLLKKLSPRMWLLLLAGVVVLYLILAPERRQSA